MIGIDALSITLGKQHVVEALTLSLQRGRVTAILGANGAGKTSLLRAIAGLVPPSAGSISIDGTPITALSLPERARRLGYLPQNGQPAWALTVRELVALGRLPHRSPFAALSPGDEVAIDAAMAQTDVKHLADRTVDTLSGGEKARAKFARVLAAETDWILADEPLANLDPPHQVDWLEQVHCLLAQGTTVVSVLHEIGMALHADDVVVMQDGRVVHHGACADEATQRAIESVFDQRIRIVSVDGQSVALPRL
jgi:iron complex transport system ATP-binding protein